VLVGLRESIESLRCIVATLDPGALDGTEAKELVAASAELERLAGAVRTLAAGRVAQTGAWANDGPFRDAAAWMADVAGVTIGRARATIETADRLTTLPKVDAALRSGSLSEVQVDVISTAAAANPRAQAALLHSAEIDGVKGLKQACARVEAAASTDQAERYERAQENRYLRHRRISDVEGLFEMRGPIDETARVYAALAPIEADLFKQVRGCEPDDREPPEARAFDAMVLMADDSATVSFESSGRRAPATVVVRVDHSAFARGGTEHGEVCEIVGVGPVPVAVAQKLSSDAIFKALITDGTDIRSISHLSRTIPARLRTAVEELYPECVVAGCHVDRHLEIDHNIPVEEHGPTALWNLNRVCHHHHDLKTKGKLRLEGEGLHQRLVPGPRPPPDP
jgi:hypothetical protein